MATKKKQKKVNPQQKVSVDVGHADQRKNLFQHSGFSPNDKKSKSITAQPPAKRSWR